MKEILSLLIILMLVTTAVSVAAIKIDNENDDIKNIQASDIENVKVGRIWVHGDVSPYVRVTPEPNMASYVANSGKTFQFYAEYYVTAPGGFYDLSEAWMKVYVNGNKVRDKSNYHVKTDEAKKEGYFVFEQTCYPGDTLKFELFGKDSDNGGTTVTGPIKETFEIAIRKADVRLCSEGEIKGTNLKRSSNNCVGNGVKIWAETGSPGEGPLDIEIQWAVSEDRLYGDWDFYPDSDWISVEDGDQEIEVWVTIGSNAEDIKGSVRIEEVGNEDNYVDIPIDITVKKAKTASNQKSFDSLLVNLFENFPLLLQRLPAFQQLL